MCVRKSKGRKLLSTPSCDKIYRSIITASKADNSVAKYEMYSLLSFALIIWTIIALVSGKFLHEWKDRKTKKNEALQISLLLDEKGYKVFINIHKRCEDFDVGMH